MVESDMTAANLPNAKNSTGHRRPFKLLGLHALTFIHPGVGQVMGAIDLPVSSETTTCSPYIAGSSLKGALRDVAHRQWGEPDKDPQKRENTTFGNTNEAAGSLILSDARLLLLPVRCIDSGFRYLTCPQILTRFKLDLGLAGETLDLSPNAFLNLASGSAAVCTEHPDKLILEELVFDADASTAEQIGKVICAITKLAPASALTEEDLKKRIAIVTNDEFGWFARNGLPVRMRNSLYDDSKTVKPGHLWSEEYLAPESLLYMLAGSRSAASEPLTRLQELLEGDGYYLQVGGNETLGQGWFLTRFFGQTAP
ncbi:MAG: type III-B CRISPR module RAMP protein Cmr4 [Geminicoccaceae bacterium]